MDSPPTDQDETVKKLQQKLNELRQQRVLVDEANETLRKKLETLSSHLDSLDTKYGKHGKDTKDDAENTNPSL